MQQTKEQALQFLENALDTAIVKGQVFNRADVINIHNALVVLKTPEPEPKPAEKN